MDISEIIKAFGAAGAAGFLAGVALVTWVRPETTKGSLFLILLVICLAVVIFATVRAIWRFFSPEKPPKPPAGQ